MRGLAARNTKRWISLLDNLTKELNNKHVTGTNITRKYVTARDVPEIISQQSGSEDPYAAMWIMNRSRFINDVSDKIFKFKVGEKVSLSAFADYRNKDTFLKATEKGVFSTEEHVVVGKELRADKSFEYLIPVYKLRSLPRSIFYETELRPVSGSWVPNKTS